MLPNHGGLLLFVRDVAECLVDAVHFYIVSSACILFGILECFCHGVPKPDLSFGDLSYSMEVNVEPVIFCTERRYELPI